MPILVRQAAKDPLSLLRERAKTKCVNLSDVFLHVLGGRYSEKNF